MPETIVIPGRRHRFDAQSIASHQGIPRPSHPPRLLCSACGHDVPLGSTAQRCAHCHGTCWERIPPLIDQSMVGLTAATIAKIAGRRRVGVRGE